MTAARLSVTLLLATAGGLAVTGCVISLGDDDTTCAFRPAPAIALTTVVDPDSLACRELPVCGCGQPCPDDPSAPQPTWGACQSQCTGLDANTCADTAGCRAAWDFTCLLTEALCTLPDPYFGCFAIDSSGPPAGACDGLDALDCSRRDDCAATYRRDARCTDGRDDDADGLIDELDECLSFAVCIAELHR